MDLALSFMEWNPQPSDDLFREEVLRARAMDPQVKLASGFELFEFACEITRAGIRHQFPHAPDPEVEAILAERLALQQRLEIGQWKPKK